MNDTNERRLKEAHAVGAISGTLACLRAAIDSKTPPPLGKIGGQLASGLFALLEQWREDAPSARNAALKGYCDGIQQTVMRQLFQDNSPLISDDVELPDTPEIRALVAEIQRIRSKDEK